MRALVALSVSCLSIASITEAGEVAERAAERFQGELPAARLYKTDSRITHVYGPSMGFGATPRDAADAFIENHAEMFGVLPANLHFERSFELMHGKFTAVQYDQLHEGIEVWLPDYKAGITILTRADVGHGIVLVSADLYDMLGVRLDPPVISGEQAVASVTVQNAGFAFTAPELAVFAGEGKPGFAYRLTGERGDLASQEKYEFFVDAAKLDAPVLHRESLVYHIDVEGNTSGWATQGMGSDQCALDGLEAMPYTTVNIQNGNSAFSDEFGDFVIPHGGTDPVTVESPVRGRYFQVVNGAEDDTVLQLGVTPPGPANFEHDAEQIQFKREINGYIEANVVRDYTLRYSPDYPVIRDQTGFTVNVNLRSQCNATYTRTAINFFRAGGGCPDTAYGTVVHHEYGHHLVNTGGSGQAWYGEGAGDVTGLVITDDPRLAPGFYGNCDESLRHAENYRSYPCTGNIHDCAQLLSGCVWDTRNELIFTEPANYRDILGALWFNSIPLHRGLEITPQITIDWLTLDDDDDHIGNGTPHYDEIAAGFGRHDMDAPPIALVVFRFPNGLPDMIAPSGGDRVRVDIEDVIGQAEPGTGMLHYGVAGEFSIVPMEEIGHNVYDIVFPPAACGPFVQYFVSVETTDGDTVTEPLNAPETVFEALSAFDTEIQFADDFEQENGWTVVNEDVQAGSWARVVPDGRGGGAPTADFDGSGHCYVTGEPFLQDVDGGPTRLTSPRFDLTIGDGYVSYARWFAAAAEDLFVVEVSNDGGASWVEIERVDDPGRRWVESGFRVGEFVPPTENVRVRFSATDVAPDSSTEAALDAFELIAVICSGTGECLRDPAWQCDGDVDGDGQVNPVDSGLVQAAFGSIDEQDVCNYDVDCDGQINPVDSGIVQSLFGTCEEPRPVCP